MYNLGRYSAKNLPEIRLQVGLLDRILEAVAAILLLLIWIFSVYIYIHLPANEAVGKVWITAIVGTFIMVTSAAMSYISIRSINFPFHLTEQTMVIQYLYATRFARVLTIMLGGMFLLGVLSNAETLFAIQTGFFKMLMSVSVIGLLVAAIGYYGMAYRHR